MEGSATSIKFRSSASTYFTDWIAVVSVLLLLHYAITSNHTGQLSSICSEVLSWL